MFRLFQQIISTRQKQELLTIHLLKFGMVLSIQQIVIYGLLDVLPMKCVHFFPHSEARVFLNYFNWFKVGNMNKFQNNTQTN